MMRKIIFFLITMITALIVGCASPLYLKHDSKSFESKEYFSDKTECGLYANSAAPVVYRRDGLQGRDKSIWTNTYYDCMRGKGWYAVDENGDKIEYERCEHPICFGN
ncbi:MAG TPA: hypothetical protein ENI94_01340 [Gammaproteobacteria bacterium]|nr:hypothetical protein [Gammaproteobacteria bacterium]